MGPCTQCTREVLGNCVSEGGRGRSEQLQGPPWPACGASFAWDPQPHGQMGTSGPGVAGPALETRKTVSTDCVLRATRPPEPRPSVPADGEGQGSGAASRPKAGRQTGATPGVSRPILRPVDSDPVGSVPRTLAATPSKSRSALDSSHCILCLTSTLCPQPPRPAASKRHAEACWPPGLPPLPTDRPHPLSLCPHCPPGPHPLPTCLPIAPKALATLPVSPFLTRVRSAVRGYPFQHSKAALHTPPSTRPGPVQPHAGTPN